MNKDTIEKIREASDVVEVISDYLTLKKKGQNYSACCPFHDEKTPSFSVHSGKGIYKCFGCGKGGDSIQFVMDIEGVSYVEALRQLAQKYGIEVEEEEFRSSFDQAKATEKESLLIVLNYAKDYFKDILHNHEDGKAIGLSYFKERGFTETTINKFDLGYSLEEWEALTRSAIDKKYDTAVLEKAGLVLPREKQDANKLPFYDRFRGRVIFPIHNVTGKVIAFGARILKTDKNQPKYINSPETEVYHKSKILYGIHQAKQAIRNLDNCFLVEGYTDVLSLHQVGIENVVASSGTSLTKDQIKLISRYSQNITVLYDGDAAGIKASLRGIDLILEEGLNVHVVLFPDKEDPDSYARRVGGAAFKEFLEKNRKDFITFKTQLYLKEAGKDPIKKAEVIREIVTSITKIPDSIKRAIFIKECSELLEIDEQVLISENNKIHLKASKDKKKEPDFPFPDIPFDSIGLDEPVEEKKQDIVLLHEKEIMRLLINYAADCIDDQTKVSNYLLSEIEDIEFTSPLYQKIISHLRAELERGNEVNETFFIGHEDEEIRKEAIDLLATKYALSDNWEKFQIFVVQEKHNLPNTVFTSILRLKWRNIQAMIKENKNSLQQTQDESEMETCMKLHMKLKDAEREIAKMLGNVLWG